MAQKTHLLCLPSPPTTPNSKGSPPPLGLGNGSGEAITERSFLTVHREFRELNRAVREHRGELDVPWWEILISVRGYLNRILKDE